jgi:hypothetical protein
MEIKDFEADRPCWVHATGHDFTPGTTLVVRRSTWLRDDDQWLEPINEILRRHNAELVARDTVEDKTMMFGEAELSVYLLHEPALVGAA